MENFWPALIKLLTAPMKYLFKTFSFAFIGRKVLPPPSNLHYSFGQLCKLKWTWNPAEGISSGCDLKYCSEILINGIPQDNREDVSLNEVVHFRVRSECKFGNTSELSAAGTAAVGINCTWYDLEYMICTWLPGRNASASTNYTLYYCTRYTSDLFFLLPIALKDPKEIRPFKNLDFFSISVKPGPPRIVTVSMIKDEIHLEWQKPGTFPAHCLVYQVELKDSKSDSPQPYNFKKFTEARFHSVHPNTVYVIKVRAGFEGTCYSSNQWSDWSEEKSIGKNNLSLLKILIYPQIPDPRKIIKRMFGEQIEDFQVKEEISSLVWLENPESSTSENEERERPALQVKAL
uniref:Interleukin 13 receptor subunit alpha 1 n=1 Tax=Chelonoidis abingdonii TaxID=106734 RepID=A0A8C0GW18_CHEAB